MSNSSVGISTQFQLTPSTPKKSSYIHKDSLAFHHVPSSLTPVSEELYTESDLILEADSASVAEAETEAATEAIRFVTTPASTELLSRKRSAQSLEDPYPAAESGSATDLVARSELCDGDFDSLSMLPPVRLSSELSNNSEHLTSQAELGTSNINAPRGSTESLRPPNKRARPSLSDPVSFVNRSVYIDPYQQGVERSNAQGIIAQQRASSAGVNIAPRAHRRGKRRTVSKSPWNVALKQLLPVLKTETIMALLLSACERHHPTAEAVRSSVAQEFGSRRLFVRNVPYSMTASELKDALESAFGAVEKVAVSSKGFAVVIFESFAAAFHAAFGHPPPETLHGTICYGLGEGLTSLSVKGRQLQFRYLPGSDSVWDILLGGPGIDVVSASTGMRDAPTEPVKNDGNSSSAAQVGPRRNRAQGNGSRRRRATELLIRDLSPSTTEVALASAFAHFGDIRRVYVPTDARGQPRGHGYVKFHKQEDALRAAQQTQRLIGDQLAFVSLAGADKSRRSRPSHAVNVTQAGAPPMTAAQRRRGRNRTLQARGKTMLEGDYASISAIPNTVGEEDVSMAGDRHLSTTSRGLVTEESCTAVVDKPSCDDVIAEGM